MDTTKLAVMAWLSVSCLLCADPAVAQESTADIVAAAIRQQGYSCSDPQAPERDQAHSEADEQAWIIRCAEGTYSVKFMGGSKPQVRPIGK